MNPLVQSFVLAGLPEKKAEQTAKNDKLAPVLAKIIANAHIVDAKKNPKQGNLLLHLATSGLGLGDNDQALLAEMVVDARIASLDQLSGEQSMK